MKKTEEYAGAIFGAAFAIFVGFALFAKYMFILLLIIAVIAIPIVLIFVFGQKKQQQQLSNLYNTTPQTTYSTPSYRGDASGYELVFDNHIEELMNRYIAFDVETTGLYPYSDRIIEVGAVLFENGQPVKEFGSIVNAERDVPPAASAVNHITSEMVRTAPSEKEVYDKLCEFLGDALNEQTIICAHNANFDISFLSFTFKRLGYNAKMHYVDTLSISRNLVKKIVDHKQPTLAQYFGIENENSHRAVADAKVCGQILYKLLLLHKEKQEQAELAEKLKKEEMQLYYDKRNEITINPINNRIPLNEITERNSKGDIYWNNGESLRKTGDIETALQLFDKARQAGFSSPELYDSYAIIFRQLKDYDNEIDILDEAIEIYREQEKYYTKFVTRRYKAICLLIKQQEKLNNQQERQKKKQQKELQKTEKKASDNVARQNKRAVFKMSDDMTVICEYESISEASRQTGVNAKSIRAAATGIQKHAGGFIWKYVNNTVDSAILEEIQASIPKMIFKTTEKLGIINAECSSNGNTYRIRWNERNPKFDVTISNAEHTKIVFCTSIEEVVDIIDY